MIYFDQRNVGGDILTDNFTDKRNTLLHKLFLLFSVVGFAAIFFLIAYRSWDNTDAEFSYRIEDGCAVIEGYSGNPTDKLEIPSEIDGYSVVAVADRAFSGQTDMKTLVLPDTVKHVGDYSFYGCTSLKKADLGSSLKTLGDYSFADCDYLRAVETPSTLEQIGVSAFEGCARLEKLAVPDVCNFIGDDAFMGCDGLVLECSEDSAAYEYAKNNSISTDFDSSNNALYFKVALLTVVSVLTVALAVVIVKRLGKKKFSEIFRKK